MKCEPEESNTTNTKSILLSDGVEIVLHPFSSFTAVRGSLGRLSLFLVDEKVVKCPTVL